MCCLLGFSRLYFRILAEHIEYRPWEYLDCSWISRYLWYKCLPLTLVSVFCVVWGSEFFRGPIWLMIGFCRLSRIVLAACSYGDCSGFVQASKGAMNFYRLGCTSSGSLSVVSHCCRSWGTGFESSFSYHLIILHFPPWLAIYKP